MRIKDIITENKVPFPVPGVNYSDAFDLGGGVKGSYYSGYLVPEEISDKRNQIIINGIKKLCDKQNAKISYTSGSNVEIEDVDGEPIFDMNFDTARIAGGPLQHSIGVEMAYAGKTKGLITQIMGYVFKELDRLHGPGFRVIEVNDDRSYGTWDKIAQRLGADYDPY